MKPFGTNQSIRYNHDMNDFIGIDLKYILRVLAKPGELGYGRSGLPLDHYCMNMDAPVDLYDDTLPVAIINIGNDEKNNIVAYVNSVYYSNIATVNNEPSGYEKIILTWFDEPMDNGGSYDN